MQTSMFEHIIGNENAKRYLTQTAHRGTVGNSLLFAGPDGVGKSLFAETFAKLLICQDDHDKQHQRKVEGGNHPDIRIYRPEGKIGMHTVAAMRQFNEEVYMAPFEAKWKIFIIHDADRMLPYSSNALLKTIEEPALDTVIILLSSNPSALLPTVLSRCRKIYFQPISEHDIAAFLMQRYSLDAYKAGQIAAMAQGSIGQAVRLLNEESSPLRACLLDLLAAGGVENYKQLCGAAEQLAEGVEAAKKLVETEVRKHLLHGGGDDLSAVQKQNVEKEVEGAVAMHVMQEAQALFAMILGWYRDLQLIGVNGNRAHLIHRDYAEACQQAFERGESLPLESVQKALGEARLSLERSTSLQNCCENLFLKLNLLK